jgi:hypothetical protein
VQALRSQERTLGKEGLHGELAEERARALRSDAAGDVTSRIGGRGEAEYPVTEEFRVGGILVGPVGADKESIPVPHLRVVSGGNEIWVADISLSGADGLGSEAGEVGGETGEEDGV